MTLLIDLGQIVLSSTSYISPKIYGFRQLRRQEIKSEYIDCYSYSAGQFLFPNCSS